MADIKLKNKSGTDVTYSGVSSITVPLASGSGTATFSIGGGGGGTVTGGYTVTFKSGDDNYQVCSVSAGNAVEAPSIPPTSSTGGFKGWSTTSSGDVDVKFPYTPTADTTFYAVFGGVILGCTGFDNSDSTLTWTDDIADLQSSDAYTTTTSGSDVTLVSPLMNYWPYNSIIKDIDDEGNEFMRFPKMWWHWITNSSGVISGFKVANYQVDSSYFIPDGFLNPDMSGDYLDYTDIGVYNASGSTSKAYSKSGETCLVSITRTNSRTACRAYGTSSNYYNGYQICDFSQWTMYVYLCYMLLRTSNCQSVYAGRTSASSASSTGTCDNITMNGWNTSSTCVKLLGIENPYGNIYQWIDGVYFSGSTIYAHRYPTQFADSTSNGVTLGFSRTTSDGYISSMRCGTSNSSRSYAYASAAGGSSSTYYADYSWYSSSGTVLRVGGLWSTGSNAGLLNLYGYHGASRSSTNIGFRLSRRKVS